MTLLAGDVGGTKTRLGIYEQSGSGLELLNSERYVSRDFPSLVAIIETFIGSNTAILAGRTIKAAAFGIPGPIVNERVKVTNLPWEFGAQEVRDFLGTKSVALVNDLVATAAAVPVMDKENFIEVYPGNGTPISGDLGLVLAPGTGLGQAYIFHQSGRYWFLPSEGGHANFAASTDLEQGLLRYLKTKLPHVSVESVLCGPGLANIYSFLRDTEVAPEPPELRDELEGSDRGAVIAKHAMNETHEIAVVALTMFCRFLGAHASDTVLSSLTTRGVYLGGGISPKIAPFLVKGAFMEGYLDKYKCKDRVEATAVSIINDDRAALIGAGNIAAQLVS